MAKTRISCNDHCSAIMAKWARAEIKQRKLSLSEIAARVGLNEDRLKRRLDVGLPNRGNYRSWEPDFIERLSIALGHESCHMFAVVDGYMMRDKETRTQD